MSYRVENTKTHLFVTRRNLSPVLYLQGMAKDLMFLLTNKNNAMILECQTTGDNMEIITKAQGNVQVM